MGVIIPTARLLDGIKGPDTTPGLLGTAFLCPNVRTPFPPRALPSRRRRAGRLSRFISHWPCNAARPEWGDSATIYPGCLSETSLNGLPVCLSDLDPAFADRWPLIADWYSHFQDVQTAHMAQNSSGGTMYSFQSSSLVFDAAQLSAVPSEHQVWFRYLSESAPWTLLSVQCEIVDIVVSTQSEENSPKPTQLYIWSQNADHDLQIQNMSDVTLLPGSPARITTILPQGRTCLWPICTRCVYFPSLPHLNTRQCNPLHSSLVRGPHSISTSVF